MPNIEPLYIAIFIAIVIGVVWYFQHKKDKHAQEVGDNLLKKAAGDKRNAGALSDNASVDEESVPVLTAADEDPEAAEGAAAAVSTQPLEETVSVPVQQPAEPVAQPVVSQDALRAPTVQRRKPEVDPAVEAVINITPLDGSFDIRLLKQRIADIEAEPLLKDLVRVQCFDKVSGLWYDGADRVTECTQIYLSMLLANRSRCVDQPTASKFMIHAEQFAIELKGESETPDSNEMIQGAERIQRIIDAGHELGSHGNNLINMTEVSYARVQENIRELNDLCEETFGVRPRLFCAHLGATNSIVTAIARAEGVEDCLFAIDACDWSDAYKDKVYQMVYRVTSDRVTSGCVVQFHINGYHTAEVLDKALDNWINVKGLRPVTVGELMQLSGRDFPPLPDYGD